MIRVAKKILRFLGAEVAATEPVHIHPSIQKGENCVIDPSAILTCSDQSIIKLEGDNYIGRNVEIGPIQLISLGSHTSIQDRCVLLGDIEIGRGCLFAPNVFISSGRHYFQLKPEYSIKDQDEMVRNSPELMAKHSQKICIEDDCWIGVNVVIQPGITISKGSIIGANAVVTKDVKPYSVMGGIPAKLIKQRLELKLKTQLLYTEDSDLPYFYSGFYTRNNELQVDRKLGGIRSRSEFSFYLLADATKTLRIKGTNCNQSVIFIHYSGQTKELETGNFTIDFNCGTEVIHKFRLGETIEEFGKSSVKNILIQEVKIL